MNEPIHIFLLFLITLATGSQSAFAKSSEVSGYNTQSPSQNNPEVTIKGRLLAGQSEADPFIVAFEMTAPRPIHGATLSIMRYNNAQSSRTIAV